MTKWLPLAPVTDRPGSTQFLQYLATQERAIAAAGTGGAPAWGAITGTLSAQTDLQTALDAKAASSHTHTASAVTDFSEAVDDRVAALLTAGTNITLTYNDAGNTLTIDAAGGGGASPIMSWVI